MEIITHRLGSEHRHRQRPQMGVERVGHGFCVGGLFQVEVGDLAGGVNTGVGAPGADQFALHALVLFLAQPLSHPALD